MPNEEHLRILKSGVKEWNKWRKGNREVKPNLISADFRGIDLRNVNLRYTNLSSANLREADLRKADLYYSNLRSADLYSADLYNADLSFADLYGANLSDADLRHTNLNFAELRFADLRKAILRDADLRDVDLTSADLREADLQYADLISANLTSINFSFADLRSTNLQYADLREANLREADLKFANLRRANLSFANLISANLTDVVLNFTIFDQTDFDNCRLGNTIFSFTNLSKAKNLDKIIAREECSIDFRTLQNSPNIPRSFLKKIGLPELYIEYLPDFYDGQSLVAYPVFLSHAFEDHQLSVKLYQALSDNGVLCWFDEKKILPGDDIYKTVVQKIKLYDKMVLVCSEASLRNSWWVEKEISEAMNKEKQLRESTDEPIDIIVPITIDDYVFDEWDHKYKTYIMDKHIGDFRNWQDASAFEEALQKLVKALKVDRRGEAPPSILNIDLPK